MPLRDVVESGRLTTLGRIRLGWQEPNASGRGEHAVQSDHFVFRDTPALEALFGDACQTLKIKFPFPDFDRNILASYRVWGGGRSKGSGICLCEGDGERVLSALPFKVSYKQNGEASVGRAAGDRWVSYGKAATDLTWGVHTFREGDVVPCPGKERTLYPHCEACRPNILLNIEIQHPDLNVFGYWQVGTQSLNNYRHFLSVWDKLTKKPDGTRYPIPMNDVPFTLSVRPGRTLFQGQDKMWAASEKFYLHLQLDPEMVALLNQWRARRLVGLLQDRPVDVPRLAPVEVSYEGEDDPLPFDEPPVEDVQDTEPPWDEGVFEDAEGEEGDEQEEPPRKAYSFRAEQIQAVIKAKSAENPHEASAMLNLSSILTPDDKVARIVDWAARYRARRDQGVEPDAAAAAADKAISKKE